VYYSVFAVAVVDVGVGSVAVREQLCLTLVNPTLALLVNNNLGHYGRLRLLLLRLLLLLLVLSIQIWSEGPSNTATNATSLLLLLLLLVRVVVRRIVVVVVVFVRHVFLLY